MTFEQLYYFAQTYRLKSITKAADNLYVSRQSVSKAIHKLENEFRLPLFVRHTDGVKPTLAGDIQANHGTTGGHRECAQ